MADPVAIAYNGRKRLLISQQSFARGILKLYGGAEARLKRVLSALEAEIAGLDPDIPAYVFVERERVRLLLRQIQQEIEKLAPNATKRTVSATKSAVKSADDKENRIAKTMRVTGHVRLPTEALQRIAADMADGASLQTTFSALGKEAYDKAREIMFEGMASGSSAKTIGRALRQALGMTKKRALLIARATTLRAYRESAIEVYRYNSSRVTGWRWLASKSRRTCASCLGLDGTEHPLTEPFGSHPLCRCTTVPVLASGNVPMSKTGAQWFDEQPESVQRHILGRGKYRLYKNGNIKLADVVDRHDSAWGPTANVKPIKRLIAESKITVAQGVAAIKGHPIPD